jgi:hypothetical protein
MRRVCPRGHETYNDGETICAYCGRPLPPVDLAETTSWQRPETPEEPEPVDLAETTSWQRPETPEEPEPERDPETAADHDPERDNLPVGYADVVISPEPGGGGSGSVDWSDGLTVALPRRVHQDPASPDATLRLAIDTSAPIPEPSSRELDLTLKFQRPQQPPPRSPNWQSAPPATYQLEEEPPQRGRSATIITAAVVGLLVGILAGYLIGRATSPRSSTATRQSSGTVIPTSPSTSSSASSTPLFRTGSRGDAVQRLQQALVAAHYSPGSVDGSFGNGTRQALRQFQSNHSLPATGIADAATWRALLGIGG